MSRVGFEPTMLKLTTDLQSATINRSATLKNKIIINRLGKIRTFITNFASLRFNQLNYKKLIIIYIFFY